MRRFALVLALLLVLSGCVSFSPGTDPGTDVTDTPRGPVTDAPPSATPPDDGFEAEVVEVVDGDTIKVVMPDGSRETARLLGVDTPEVHGENTPGEFEGVPETDAGKACLRSWGEEASAYTKERLLGETVTLSYDENEPQRGYYGRLLVYVHDDEGEFNYALITHGLARVYDSKFQYRERYYEAESAAMKGGVGLWACREGGAGSTPTPRATPTATATETIADGGIPLRVSEIHADAAGNDGENLNDEYVVLKNVGDSDLDLSGWTVADAADHEYTFPGGTTLGAGESLTLRTGSGSDSGGEYYWGANSPIWNNGGDTVTVRTADGEVVVEKTYSG